MITLKTTRYYTMRKSHQVKRFITFKWDKDGNSIKPNKFTFIKLTAFNNK